MLPPNQNTLPAGSLGHSWAARGCQLWPQGRKFWATDGWVSLAFLPPHPRRGVRANSHTTVTLERKAQEKGGKTEHRSGTDTVVGADCEGTQGKGLPGNDSPVCFLLINVVSLQPPCRFPAGRLNHNNTWPARPRPGTEIGASQGGSSFTLSRAVLPFTGFVQGRDRTAPQAVETAGLGEQPGPGCHRLAWLRVPTALTRGQRPPDGAAAAQSSASGENSFKEPLLGLTTTAMT